MNTAKPFRLLAPRHAEALTHCARDLFNREPTQAMQLSVTNSNNLLAEWFYKFQLRPTILAIHFRNNWEEIA
ncbi:hypothetical protein [Microbulbifer sp. THAF38]|uniref:hypothetical protein n=1 Tax=Microbulbifer sp. THAF38 TaxID=2587856 RepID=UPI0012696FD7|nr:hypothetical protein [Microbulbifer sp. THAF38]QFT54572.1 hypothetical protein FIU95_08410 [Microbulbifer sp. THAF38]